MPEWGSEILIMDDLMHQLMPRGITITRLYIKRDGEWAEMVRVFDCEKHLMSKDRCESVCIFSKPTMQIAPEFLRRMGQTWVCTHICPYKKWKTEQILKNHSDRLTQDQMVAMLELLEKEDTI